MLVTTDSVKKRRLYDVYTTNESNGTELTRNDRLTANTITAKPTNQFTRTESDFSHVNYNSSSLSYDNNFL